ncbi:MAG: cytidylate kinase-like family protein [Desulfohalobiaceae bacterium]|nr:cytidylate kinase-like family protein [Desulfohalobiaceae bacterium]
MNCYRFDMSKRLVDQLLFNGQPLRQESIFKGKEKHFTRGGQRMTLVMISSMDQCGREELARALSAKTGWPLHSREELQEQAKKQGIRVGRLEVSMIKRPSLSERLAREKNMYLAFLTATLCDWALKGPFIYYGRAGHLLLPGVGHRLRVGLTLPPTLRIQKTADSLKMQPEQADSYLRRLEEDIGKWIHYIHHVPEASIKDPGQFDVFFNLEKTSVNNSAETVYHMAQLPEYQPTKNSIRVLQDLSLSVRAELRLNTDERTRGSDLKVQAENRVLTVTYPPHQETVSSCIPQVLSDLPDCREIQCTMAETNILWVQERFDPESENFQQILQLAQRWGAAVELMRLISPDESAGYDMQGQDTQLLTLIRQGDSHLSDGGVEDDEPETIGNDGGLSATIETLIHQGRCGGGHTVFGGYDKILERVKDDADYALVVVGDMFLTKGQSTRTRRTRELTMTIRDRLKAPVITADELQSRFLFGRRQALSLIGYALLVVLLYFLVFSNQEAVLAFLSGPVHQKVKWLAPLVIVLFIPLIAYLYSTVTGLALKIINID